MPKVLVTGGCGYIGSHTLVDLIENDFEVFSIDSLVNGSERALDGIKAITGKKVKNYAIDLCDIQALRSVMAEEGQVDGIIHFAALKLVGESAREPLKYFQNNLSSLINVLQVAEENDINAFVFSSSCSVYGDAEQLPVTESTPWNEARSPYARTKQMGEGIIHDSASTRPNAKFTLLRYFNPVGAHPTAEIGEYAEDKPENLVPIITQTAIGKREKMAVYGSDYPTRDGSCIRDYVHVSDIAHAHTLALMKLFNDEQPEQTEAYNLGSGDGLTVLELIAAFEKVSGKKLTYDMAGRREGDVVAIYADNTKASTELKWQTNHDIDTMMRSAWAWQQRLSGK